MIRYRFALAIALASTCSASARADYQPFVGVSYSHTDTVIGGRQVAYDVLDIDPSAPGLSFKVSESNGAAPGDTNLETTRSAVAREGAQIGINAHFFKSLTGVYHAGDPATVGGLAASNGDAYHAWQMGWASVDIAMENTVTFLDAAPASPYNVVSGSYRLVRDGVAGSFDAPIDLLADARTALALDNRGHLLLVTVDGRNPGHSMGVTVNELATLLVGPLHAIQAINLDGGGSTTMVMADLGAPRVVNVPVGQDFMPGTERPVATSLVVFARAVPEPGSLALFAVGGALLGLKIRKGLSARTEDSCSFSGDRQRAA